MIKFFNSIRKKLLSEGRFGKYLLYALGEIILVVIGILIALQVNTWNENKKNAKVERSYLEGIVSNLNDDIEELERVLARDTATFKAYTRILKPFNDDSEVIYSAGFIGAIGDAQFTQQFDGNSIVFEDMKSSGKINFVNSDALRFALLEYYNLSSQCIDTHITNNGQINSLKNEAFTTNLDLNSLIEGFIFKPPLSAQLDGLDLSFFQKDKTLPEVKQFANRVSLMKGLLLVNHGQSGFLLERARKLQALIQSYLEGENLDYRFMSEQIVEAITNDDIKAIDSLVNDDSLWECYQLQENYPISYLSLSLELGSLEVAKYLIDRGADLELVCFDKTPLMYAAKYGHLDLVKYLLDKGAQIDFVSVEGKTALDYAINYEHPEIEQFLKTYNKE